VILAIGSDHAAFGLKDHLVRFLSEANIQVRDVGPPDAEERVDYPDYAKMVCELVLKKEARFGILLCGTGIGMSIAANKFPGIRAALAYFPEAAELSRRHNQANVLVLGGRIMGPELAEWTVSAFLNAEFEGGRHTARVEKIAQLERERLRGFLDA